MRTMHDALGLVARRLGLPEIRLNAAGFAEIILGDALPVFLRVAEDTGLEVSARIPEFGDRPGPDVLRALLRWNGQSNGARYAMEPGTFSVVLGQRIDITQGDDAQVQRSVCAFIALAATCRQSEAAGLLAGIERHPEGAADVPEGAIRL